MVIKTCSTPMMKQKGGSPDLLGPKMVQIFFCNISEWGPTAEAFMQAHRRESFHVVCLAEHHLSKRKLSSVCQKFPAYGRRVTASTAQATGRSSEGTSGGVLIAPRLTLQLGPRWLNNPKIGWTGDDWCAVPIRTKGFTYVLVTAYLTHTIGPVGVNSEKLKSIAAMLLFRGLSFIILADWNMTVDQLRASGFLHLVKGEPVLPEGVDATCNSGRLIDYAVVSRDLIPMVSEGNGSLTCFDRSPWRTHQGLLLSLLSVMIEKRLLQFIKLIL